MRSRTLASMLFLAVIAAFGLRTPAKGIVPMANPGSDAFDPVWEIMTRAPSEMGCRGCHIDSERGLGPWWGNDKTTVLKTLESGKTPDGELLIPPPLEGGRAGLLSRLIRNGSMPLGGEPWGDDEIAILDAWLINYE